MHVGSTLAYAELRDKQMNCGPPRFLNAMTWGGACHKRLNTSPVRGLISLEQIAENPQSAGRLSPLVPQVQAGGPNLAQAAEELARLRPPAPHTGAQSVTERNNPAAPHSCEREERGSPAAGG